jgi:hypothetical protein
MKTQILSSNRVTGAQVATTEGFISIGHGLEVCIPKDAKHGDIWELTISPLKVSEPVAHTTLGSDVFISNQQELLSIIRGNLLQCGVSDSGTYDFNGKSNAVQNHRSDKIATYFNHIFLAIGRTLWWTDLDNYWNWYPSTDSEADFRILEWENSDITALCVLNEILYIHFPQAIYECTYVGKPTIVRILRRVTGSGAIAPKSCVATKNAMFFLGLENFYIWSPDIGLKEIGQEVWKKFLASSVDLQETWAYHDARNHEICWVNNGIIWAFNHVEGHWSKFSAEGAVDHTTAPWHTNFTSVARGTTGSTIESDSWKGVENLWVGCKGVMRDARLGDNMANRLPMETPYLETDDLTYGDIHSYKTTDLVVLDVEAREPWTGVRVLVGGKKRVSETVSWIDCGVWNDKKEHQDFVAVAGKALRYRFELVDDLIRADGSYTLNGGQQLTGKRVECYDGSVKLDGSRTLREASFYEQADNGERWFAEFYAWGERVNLPERLVGPDK